MTTLRALFRAVVVALAIWVGQNLVAPVNTAGIWAMISLGIASALAGALLTQYLAKSSRRIADASLQFVATTVILALFYWFLPKHGSMAGRDLILAVGVGAISGITEWLVPDLARPATTRRT